MGQDRSWWHGAHFILIMWNPEQPSGLEVRQPVVQRVRAVQSEPPDVGGVDPNRATVELPVEPAERTLSIPGLNDRLTPPRVASPGDGTRRIRPCPNNPEVISA